MKNGYKFDLLKNTLILSHVFAEKAANPDTTEYSLFCKFRTDNPDAVVSYEGKRKTANRDISTKEMKAYIALCDDKDARMKEFNRQTVLSKVQKHPLKYMQNWFHDNYANYSNSPEYKDEHVIVKTRAQMESEQQTAAAQNTSVQTLEDKKNRDSGTAQVSLSAKSRKNPSEKKDVA